MRSSQKTMVFDLDGTLVDSVLDLVPALNHATALDGLPPIERNHVGAVVGKGALKMIELAFALHGHPLAPARQQELLGVFLEYYEAHIADQTVFYPGTLAALDTLAQDGWQLAVCTNKYQHLAEKLLHELGSAQVFATITGGDTFDFRKPDPRHILETIALAGGDPARSIMVGDSINDVKAAQDAQVPVIAVDFGYTDIPVSQMSPTAIISHFDQLSGAAQDLSKKFN